MQKLLLIASIAFASIASANEVRLPLNSAIKSLDPESFIYAPVILGIYETLYQYRYDAETPTLEPLVAQSLPSVTSDGLTVTIPIKRGIVFADDPCFAEGRGRELTAADVVFSLKRTLSPKLPRGRFVLEGRTKSIVAINPHTVQIKLKKPDPQLAFGLAIMVTAIVPHEAVEKYGDENGENLDHPVGSGPYRLKEWRRGHLLVLERNPSYHADFYKGKRLPLVDKVSFEAIDEESAAWLKFLAGQFDFIDETKTLAGKAVELHERLTPAPELAEKKISISASDIGGVGFLWFNMKDPLLGRSAYLRQAISSAIDRDEWSHLFFSSAAPKMTALLPPGIAGRPENPQLKFDFDLAHAKELLAQAGYPNGQGLPALRIDMPDTTTTSQHQGEFIARSLGAIGIKTELLTDTPAMFYEKRDKNLLQIFPGTWTLDYPDAENIYALFYGPNHAPGPNSGSFEDAGFDHTYEKVAASQSGPTRSLRIAKLESTLQEQVPLVMLDYKRSYYFVQPWLQNFHNSQLLWNYLKYLQTDRR